MRVAENGLFYVYTVFVLSYGPAAWPLARHDALGRQLAALVGLVAIPLFRRAVGPRRPPAGLPLRRGVLARLRAAVLLAARDPVARRHLAGDRAGRRPRPRRDVRARRPPTSRSSSAPASATAAPRSAISCVGAAGGLAPFIATALLANWGTHAVAGYMMLLASITVAAAYAAPETHRGGLAE